MLIHHQKITNMESLVGEHPHYIDGHEITRICGGKPSEQRKSGWHLAGILRAMAITLDIVDYESNGDGWEDWGEIEEVPTGPKTLDQIQALLAGANGDVVIDNLLGDYKVLIPDQLAQLNVVKRFQWSLEVFKGFQWEEWIVKRIPSISGTIWRPNQYPIPISGSDQVVWSSPDGVSPEVKWLDGVKVDNGLGKLVIPNSPNYGRIVTCGEEFKCTKKSSRKPIEKEWLWLNQIMGYAQPDCLDTMFFRLHVQYTNGRYEKARLGEAEYWCYWIELNPYELSSMWKRVETYVKNSERERLKKANSFIR